MAADPADRRPAVPAPQPGTGRPVTPPAPGLARGAVPQHPVSRFGTAPATVPATPAAARPVYTPRVTPGAPGASAGTAARPASTPPRLASTPPAGTARPSAFGAGAGATPTAGTALERLAARQAAAGTALTAPRPTSTTTAARAPLSAPGVSRPPLAGASAPRTPITGTTAPRPPLSVSSVPRPPLAAPRAPLAAPRPPLGAAATRPALGATRPGATPAAPGARPAFTPSTPRRTPATPMVIPTPGEIEASVDHAAYERFAAGIKTLLGFDLTQYKRPQVWRRANSFAKQKGCADVHELVERCKTDMDLRTAVRDMITINVSEFFRNPDAWESLRTVALPDLLRAGRPIRMWSAGCSLGYEPYTFAMMVKEVGLGADTKIQATDLDETILAQARASSYAEHQMVGVSPARRSKFFDQVGDRWVVKPALRSMVSWRRQDLLRDPFPTDQDLIACRNVVIYFTDEAKDGLYRHFTQALRIGGVLFIGATEAISSPRDFGLQMITSGIYRRVA